MLLLMDHFSLSVVNPRRLLMRTLIWQMKERHQDLVNKHEVKILLVLVPEPGSFQLLGDQRQLVAYALLVNNAIPSRIAFMPIQSKHRSGLNQNPL